MTSKPFEPDRHGSDVYDLEERDRIPLFNPRDDRYKK
jgi:hypothetical protein